MLDIKLIAPDIPEDFTPTFSGHETFVLRSTWLKKGYDLLLEHPDLFARDDAFVLLGVGKNMANSIRYWGRVCGVFERSEPTPLGYKLLADDGWDPFLVTATSWYLLHWNIAAHPQAAFTWFYTFNLLRGGEFEVAKLVEQLQAYASEHDWRVPSYETISRDVKCMIQCYVPPTRKQLALSSEDALLCPLTELGLIQSIPGMQSYLLRSSTQTALSDEMLAYTIHDVMHRKGQKTISFHELMYAPRSPGRVFRLHEDALLERLQRLNHVTEGKAYYTDQAGIRQVAWNGDTGIAVGDMLLQRAFEIEDV